MMLNLYELTCVDPGSFVRGGSTLTTFLVDEGREDPQNAGQPRPASEAFRWRDDDGPTLNAGLVAL